MQQSPNMDLTLWDDLDDPYDHNELVQNWNKIDDHNHTAGNGVQIPTGGLVDDAVTNAKLAPNSVTTAEILDGTILAQDIADGAISVSKLNTAALSALAPLGQVTAWFRPTTAVPIPTGYRVCDGSLVPNGEHDWGAGGVTIPNLQNRFVLGAALTGTGTGAGTPPAEGATGGSHTQTFPHTHTVNAHSHTVDSHSHVVNAHSHVGPVHNHFIGGDGGHTHFTNQAWRGNNNVNREPPGSPESYIENFAFQNHGHTLDQSGWHDHGGATGSASGTTETSAPGTSAVAPGTNAVGLTTNSSNGGGDIRPGFVGLLYIVKVKNP